MTKSKKAFAVAVVAGVALGVAHGCGTTRPATWDGAKWDEATWSNTPDAGTAEEK